MKPLTLLLLLAFLLVGCAADEPAPETAVVAPAVVAPPAVAPPAVAMTAASSPTAPTAATDTAPAATESATAAPATVAPAPTSTAPATEPAAPVVGYGRTADGAFFHGAADAPVALIDYSDFL